LKLDKDSEVFLDTTFLLPFFQVNIAIEGFTLKKFKKFLMQLSKVHFSELSIYEAKAKIYRLSRKDSTYMKALENFGTNLSILRADEKIIFHPYTERDDEYFNIISSKNLKLNSFDMIILAQALNGDILLTEDKEILKIRRQKEIVEDPVLRKIVISRWNELEL